VPRFKFGNLIVLDGSGKPAALAPGNVYAESDTTFSDPLPVTDLHGLPQDLVSNTYGLLPEFQVDADRGIVVWKSGDMPPQALLAVEAVVEWAQGAAAAAETSATSAAVSRDAAEEAAKAAAQRGIPAGGLPSQAPIKMGPNDYQVGWGNVVHLVGDQPLRLWGVASSLPPAGSGQEPGDVIFVIGGGA